MMKIRSCFYLALAVFLLGGCIEKVQVKHLRTGTAEAHLPTDNIVVVRSNDQLFDVFTKSHEGEYPVYFSPNLFLSELDFSKDILILAKCTQDVVRAEPSFSITRNKDVANTVEIRIEPGRPKEDFKSKHYKAHCFAFTVAKLGCDRIAFRTFNEMLIPEFRDDILSVHESSRVATILPIPSRVFTTSEVGSEVFASSEEFMNFCQTNSGQSVADFLGKLRSKEIDFTSQYLVVICSGLKSSSIYSWLEPPVLDGSSLVCSIRHQVPRGRQTDLCSDWFAVTVPKRKISQVVIKGHVYHPPGSEAVQIVDLE